MQPIREHFAEDAAPLSNCRIVGSLQSLRTLPRLLRGQRVSLVGQENVMTWFRELTGFDEISPTQVRANIEVNGEFLTSRVNGTRYRCGRLETPPLAELQSRASATVAPSRATTVREVVANVQDLHADIANAGAFFQVASQFNLLEMISPHVTPEHGVGIYEQDLTQGPACAIAAGAGTIYRNYFVPVNGRIGQTQDNQIDCLVGLAELLGTGDPRLWTMRNGYALPTREGLEQVSRRLQACSEAELEQLRQQLRIGVQSETQVTHAGCQHVVSQGYCSAMPVAYSRLPADLWDPLARLILEAAYDAVLCAAIIHAKPIGHPRVYLTLLGGGAFGNPAEWITAALARALSRHRGAGLDVVIVSYGRSQSCVRQLVEAYVAGRISESPNDRRSSWAAESLTKDGE